MTARIFGTDPDPPPPTQMEVQALSTAVQSYIAIAKQEGPVSAAAFGFACGGLMETLNISLTVAALLLRTELERRQLP